LRLQHFEEYRPLCPNCRSIDGSIESRLILENVIAREADIIREGILRCSSNSCQSEFPIIDGCPIILSNLRSFVQENMVGLMARNDLSPTIESLLGDCCGPSSAYDVTRQHLSSYAWDHYGEFDVSEPADALPGPGAIVRVLEQALRLSADQPESNRSDSSSRTDSSSPLPGLNPLQGLVVDLGCGAGRTSFEMAGHSQALVLGLDLHVPMIRLASQVLRTGQAEFPKRRNGIVYDRRPFRLESERMQNVDFWICNAISLPFAPASIQTVVSLNTLDCVPAPAELLLEANRVLKVGGHALLSCPYDWASSATPIEQWIGGHSQRGPLAGDPVLTLRSWLDSLAGTHEEFRLRLTCERDNVPWHVRMHDRSYVEYRLHLVRLDKRPTAILTEPNSRTD
jgi:SAM-dependent methyltransferase/uncharacterized protein YbaR (Trm112 family)